MYFGGSVLFSSVPVYVGCIMMLLCGWLTCHLSPRAAAAAAAAAVVVGVVVIVVVAVVVGGGVSAVARTVYVWMKCAASCFPGR